MHSKQILQKKLLWIPILLILLAIAGCTLPTPPTTPMPGTETPSAITEESTPATDGVPSLENTSWVLVSWGTPGAETAVIADSNITLELNAAGKAGGYGGCNTYGGSYEVQGDMLVLGEIVSTLMACADQAVTEQEMVYLAALQTAGRFELTDGALTIFYDDETSVLNFAAAAPTAPLDATSVITPGATLTATETLTPTALIQPSGQ